MKPLYAWLVAPVAALSIAAASHAATFSLSNNNDPNVGPLLANWSTQENIFNGVSINGWSDNSSSFANNTTNYSTGIGMRDAGSSTAGYTEWWLDGNYTSFNATMFVDDRTANALAWENFTVIGDGVTLASSNFTGYQAGSVGLSNVNVTGVKLLRVKVAGDGWGGRPQTYDFFTSASVTGKAAAYYHDTLNATVSTSQDPHNSVTFTSASGQVGGTGNAPSFNTWLDNAQSLKVGGQAVTGVGLSAPTNNSISSALWTLSTGNTYRLFTFGLAPDDRFSSGFNDGNIGLYINGVLTDTYSLISGTPAVTYSYLLDNGSPTTTIEFRISTFGYGGDSKPFMDIINPEFIALPEPASLALLALGGPLVLTLRRTKE